MIDMQAVGDTIEDLMGDAFHCQYLRDSRYFSRARVQRPTTAGLTFKFKKKQSAPEMLRK